MLNPNLKKMQCENLPDYIGKDIAITRTAPNTEPETNAHRTVLLCLLFIDGLLFITTRAAQGMSTAQLHFTCLRWSSVLSPVR